MFGYIRPFKPELKFKEYDEYKAAYCSLCRTLGRKYGFIARNLLNYDFTFLAILLDCTNDLTCEKFRCPLHPLKKRDCRRQTTALSSAACISVILSWYKLCDTISDNSLPKRIAAGFAKFALLSAFRKAKREMPQYEEKVRRQLERLSEYEKNGETCLDKTADVFANILSSAVAGEGENERIFSNILYHIGRWIYIIDACDDISEDSKSGRYNPVAARFGIKDGIIDSKTKGEIIFTLENSMSAAARAFELIDFKNSKDILGNIIYYGMPSVMSSVLNRHKAKEETY